MVETKRVMDAPVTAGYLTVPETAVYLSVCRATVRNMIRRGDIPSVKLGKCRRIPVEGLRELYRTQTQTPAVA